MARIYSYGHHKTVWYSEICLENVLCFHVSSFIIVKLLIARIILVIAMKGILDFANLLNKFTNRYYMKDHHSCERCSGSCENKALKA